MEHDPMAAILQKRGPASLTLQDAAAPDAAQVVGESRFDRDPAYQRFRLMGVEVVEDYMPARDRRITVHYALNMRQEIGRREGCGASSDNQESRCLILARV